MQTQGNFAIDFSLRASSSPRCGHRSSPPRLLLPPSAIHIHIEQGSPPASPQPTKPSTAAERAVASIVLLLVSSRQSNGTPRAIPSRANHSDPCPVPQVSVALNISDGKSTLSATPNTKLKGRVGHPDSLSGTEFPCFWRLS